MQQTEPTENEGVMSAVDSPEIVQASSEGRPTEEGRFKGATREKKREKKPNPWEQAQRGSPSENWQPQAWTPGPAARR